MRAMVGFDPERAELAITIAYGLTFGLSLAACWAAPDYRHQYFWALAAVVVLALGINKPLDLQTNLTELGRTLARDGGWYASRREVQAMFIGGLAIAMGVAAILLAWLVRKLEPPAWLATAGLLLLGGFVLLRAASFHHVDVLLRTELFGTRAWVVVELSGIALVTLAALWAVANSLRYPPPSPG